MSQKTGRVTIELDGDSLTSQPGATIQLGGIEKTGEMSDQSSFHYTESEIPAEIIATIIHVADTDLIAIRAFSGVATYKTDTGVTYSVAEAQCANLAELGGGVVRATFIGRPAVQV